MPRGRSKNAPTDAIVHGCKGALCAPANKGTVKAPKLLEELRELAQDEFDDYDIEVKEFINKLQKSLKRLGHSIDFESFCNALNERLFGIKD